MKTIKTLILLTLVMMLVKPIHAGSFCFRKEKDPWQILIEVLDTYQVDTAGLNVTSPFDFTLWSNNKLDYWQNIKQDLSKAYRVRKPVDIESDAMLGEVVCAYMEAKYAKKRGEKYDYLKISYSPSFWAYLSFMAKYPDSNHNEELELKSACVAENISWRLSNDDDDRNMVYLQYGESHCSYNGFHSLSVQNNLYRKAVEDWKGVLLEQQKDPTFDCDRYEAFILNHAGSLVGFNWAVHDSLGICQQRMAWFTACELHSIDGYCDFVMDYPDSKEAETALRIIEDLSAWQLAVDDNTHASYSKYYREFPQGDSAMVAESKLKQMEEDAWQKACAKNTIESYESFVAQYPQGYYTETALKRQIDMEILKFDSKGKETIDKLEIIGISSRQGYGLICFGNVGKSNDITVLLQGKTPVKVTLKPGQSQWVWAKNGEYKIFVTSSNGSEWEENGRGTVLVEDGVYHNSWYAWTSYFTHYSDEMREILYTDKEARDRIADEALWRVYEEMEKFEKTEIGVQKRMLKNCYRQYLEKENDKEEYEKLCRDLEDDENVGLLIRTLLRQEL